MEIIDYFIGPQYLKVEETSTNFMWTKKLGSTCWLESVKRGRKAEEGLTSPPFVP